MTIPTFNYPFSGAGSYTANTLWQASADGLLALMSLNERSGSFPATTYPHMLCARPDIGTVHIYDDVGGLFVEWLPMDVPAGLRSLEVLQGALTATISRFVAPYKYRLRIDELVVVSDDATTSDGSNNWAFQLFNRSQSDETLFATAPTTNGSEIAANTTWRVACDQNRTIEADDVLELVATKTGSPGNLDHCLIVVEATLVK